MIANRHPGSRIACDSTRLLVTTRPNNFDAIRIAMALLVVWSHSFALYFGSEANEPISLLTHGAVNAGEVAVDVFFMLSGFLISKSFDRSTSSWSYLKKRIARIYPGYLVAVAIFAFVLLPLYAGTRYSAGGIVKTLTLNLALRGWFIDPAPFINNPDHALNGSLWSIPYEFWCYIGVLALGIVRIRKGALLAIFAAIVAANVWTEFTGKKFGGGIVSLVLGWPNLWFRMAPCFIAGMLLYAYRDCVPRSSRVALSGLGLFVAAAWVYPLAADAILPLALAYAVFHWGFSRQYFHAAKYGDFSYGAYLYAYPIQQLLIAFSVLSFPIFVIVSILLSLAAGIASWFAVERWFHRTNEPLPSTPRASDVAAGP